MIKKLLFILLVAMSLPLFARETKRAPRNHQIERRARSAGPARSPQQRISVGELFTPRELQWVKGNWQPGKIVGSYDIGEQVYNYTYGENGRPLKCIDIYRSPSYESTIIDDYLYDNNCRLVQNTGSRLSSWNWDGSGWQTGSLNQFECEIAYDDVIPDLVVKMTNSSKDYDDGILTFSTVQSNEKIIERDTEGNIIGYKDYHIYQDQISLTNSVSIKYDNGKASEISIWENDKAVPDYCLANIKWENTNGQIYEVSTDFEPMDFPLFHGENRIKYAEIYKDGVAYAIMQINEYEGADFILQVVYTNGDLDLFSYSESENGGWDIIAMWTEIGDNAEIETEVWGESYDEFGILTMEYDGEMDLATYEIKYDDLEFGDVVYDPVYGYPLQVTYVNMDDSGDFKVSCVYEFSDWVDTSLSAVETVEETSDAPVEYFTLDGLKVKNPVKGLYIRRQGNKTDKVYLK